LDDGSQSLEDSIAMLKLAAETGTTDIVGTPHANLEFKFQPNLISERLEELRRATGGQPRLYSGCDFHLMFDNIQDALANPTKYTINHKNYLLVEFSDMLIFQNTGDIFARMRGVGIFPIVTHPERNPLLQRRSELLKKWVQEGTYLQVTAQSLLGHFGNTAKQFSIELLRQNLVHFIASDAHDVKHRPPVLREAFHWMMKEYGPAVAERLFILNPGAAVAGAPIEPGDPLLVAKPRKWFEFWRP
jgi:protein-tyrosine phosphatase